MKVSLWFYLGALFVYFLSFISGFSIGLYVLFGAILLLFFRFGNIFQTSKKRKECFNIDRYFHYNLCRFLYRLVSFIS
ncbi:hypothetical protein B0I26_106155 [Anoxybacillus vitaminiphilus]|uniref:Uncharacterized protein n=1 Tax=Paranoxybacillus vitaminiphilus TaxID=581036 RepID=A0A327YGC0_9BACL|nr:hypothetical protein B0I26_106155 [Anoxybacillus vitaminiphilus]